MPWALTLTSGKQKSLALALTMKHYVIGLSNKTYLNVRQNMSTLYCDDESNEYSTKIYRGVNLASQRMGILKTLWNSSELTFTTTCLSHLLHRETYEVTYSRKLMAFLMRFYMRILNLCWKDRHCNNII